MMVWLNKSFFEPPYSLNLGYAPEYIILNSNIRLTSLFELDSPCDNVMDGDNTGTLPVVCCITEELLLVAASIGELVISAVSKKSWIQDNCIYSRTSEERTLWERHFVLSSWVVLLSEVFQFLHFYIMGWNISNVVRFVHQLAFT